MPYLSPNLDAELLQTLYTNIERDRQHEVRKLVMQGMMAQ
jgi:hypothetical protein